MGQKTSRENKNDIISTGSLYAVQEVLNFLKNNSQEETFLNRGRNQNIRNKILNNLRKGDYLALKSYLENNSEAVMECAAALQIFITQLREPLIPYRVQELLLAENPGVPIRVIAEDALGLLRQDLSQRHLAFLAGLLDFLYAATRKSRNSELAGCNLPTFFLPLFFELHMQQVHNWTRAALVFNELISTAPELLTYCNSMTHQTAPQSPSRSSHRPNSVLNIFVKC